MTYNVQFKQNALVYETMVMLGHKSEAITPIQKKSGIHTHKWKVYVKNSSMMKNVRLELIIEKVRSSMFHVIIRCFKGMLLKSARVQNPPDEILYFRYLLIFFNFSLIFFVNFYSFFTITIIPNPYLQLVSGSQI